MHNQRQLLRALTIMRSTVGGWKVLQRRMPAVISNLFFFAAVASGGQGVVARSRLSVGAREMKPPASVRLRGASAGEAHGSQKRSWRVTRL